MSSRKFADKVMPFLEKYNSYTEKDRILAHYGLETIYILITKFIIVTIISLCLGITKEMYIFLFFYGILRFYAGGMHLSNSKKCLILSIIIFIGITYLCIYTNMNISYRIIISGFSISSFALFSPADTHKKPIIRENVRIKRKIISICICFIFVMGIIFIKSTIVLNMLTYSLLLTSLIIAPYSYRLFRQPYNNYMAYVNYKRKEK